MKLHQLKMTNWRSFYGESNDVIFSTSASENVTVIHATNGSGKTNILNALLWLFSGDTSASFSQKNQLINRQALFQAKIGDTVECSVECVFEHHGRLNRALRSSKCTREDSVERSWGNAKISPISIMYQAENGGWEKAPSPQDFIDSIIPPSIRDFFFFDGEELKVKFSHDKKRQDALAKQMQFFFGLGAMLSTQKALATAERRLTKECSRSDDDKLTSLTTKKNNLVDQKDQAIEEKERIDEQASFYATKIEKIDSALTKLQESAELQKRRQILKDAKLLADKTMANNRVARTREIGTNGYTVFLSNLLASLSSQIEELEARGELPSDIKRPFIERLLTTNKCMCGRQLEENDNSRKNVEAWLSKSGLTDVEERVLRMSGQFAQAGKEKQLFWERLGELQQIRFEQEIIIEKTNKELAMISESLQSSADEKIHQLEKTREELQDKRETEILNQGKFTQKIQDIEAGILKVQVEIDQLKDIRDEAALALERQTIANKSLECVQEIFGARDSQLRSDLLRRIKERYRQLTVTNYEPRLSDDYCLEIVERSTGKETVVGLSKGETQVLAFCFIGSIIEIQREHVEKQGLIPAGVDATEYCIAMDSPYGQLAKNYRETVSKYIPEVTDQVILFVTDSQWQVGAQEIMGERVGKQYVLTQHATAENLEGNKLASVSLNGKDYPFVQASKTGFEWTEIKEVIDG